ncbi:LacI family DNA-binding transcriptional regulator [Streptomyces sp. NPDC005925]|uniref:helix-turn-helix domain-containing protein n=1 Tax=Streptomyces sp. NPDC005925 TaxID=3157172 RepID=UPI0033FA9A6A
MSSRVTLAAGAKEAGDSLATVSKVLAGRSDVPDATRARVEGLLDTCGYRRRARGAPRPPLLERVFHEPQAQHMTVRGHTLCGLPVPLPPVRPPRHGPPRDVPPARYGPAPTVPYAFGPGARSHGPRPGHPPRHP